MENWLRSLAALVSALALAAPFTVRAESPREATLAAWQADRFGLFIHWGPVALTGKEIGWSRRAERRGKYDPLDAYASVPAEVYDNLYRDFNPVKFDAREWVEIAKAAGMKYLVFVARHHDGFSLWDTQASEYKITSPGSPFRRDIVKELAAACHAAGLRLGFYYSQPDWYHPDAFVPGRHERYLAYMKTQVRELLTNYGQVDILWFDGLGVPSAGFDSEGIDRLARELQPQILTNDRNGQVRGDFETAEQRVGKYRDDRPWESNITLCRQWAWRPDDDMKSLKECLQTLILSVGGDGNLLFNVGPMPDGRIEPRQVGRLREMGTWIARHGESIYGTRGGPWKPTKSLASTRKDRTVFVHLLRADATPVELPDLPRKVLSAATLDGQPVKVAQGGGQLRLDLSSVTLDPIDTVVRLELDGSALDLAAIALPPEIAATSSNPLRDDGKNSPQNAVDNDPGTRWRSETGVADAWLALDLRQPRTIERVRIDVGGSRITAFEFQYRDGDAWRTIFTGTKIGAFFQRRFEPVTAQAFRLRILAADGAPAVADLELFEK